MSYRFLSASEWRLLRDVRLGALRESPGSFLSTYAREQAYDPRRWQDELDQGSWLVGTADDDVHAVVGATPGPDIDPGERYLSYLWVAPPARRSGVGTQLVKAMLRHLERTGAARVWLWVLEDNAAARAFYDKLGFVPTGERQPLTDGRGRWEARLTIVLDRHA